MSPFTLSRPLDGRAPLLLASPHCGTHVPPHVEAQLSGPRLAARRLEDPHVARLMGPAAAAHAIPLIAATHGRAVIDLNRQEDEIDVAMLEGPLPAHVTDRVRRGYGLVPRFAGGTQPLYARRIPLADLKRRIETLHRPWHRAIAAGLAAARDRHGHAILLDCHSMPSLDPVSAAGPPPDIVVGDRYGASAAPSLVDWLCQALAAEGLRVARNRPYAGGHTTQLHGRPAEGIHAVQIEIDRALYLNPATLAPAAGLAPLADTLSRVIGRLLASLPLPGLEPLPLAAE